MNQTPTAVTLGCFSNLDKQYLDSHLRNIMLFLYLHNRFNQMRSNLLGSEHPVFCRLGAPNTL